MNVVEEIRKEVERLFFKEDYSKNQRYCTKDWIFPNHLEPAIDITKKLCDKYGGDKEICEIACLLHDTGLIYKREDKSPIGHETRSLEFAKNILNKYNYDKIKTELILKCVNATEVDYKPQTNEEKIVRSADILSQFYSMHFFAKAHFYEDWDTYLKFFEKKINTGFDKICFEDERKELEPIRNYYLEIFKNYKKYNN